MNCRTAIIISIGDELLIGQVIDTNSAVIAQQLSGAGISVLKKYTIKDEAPEISNALDEAIPEADLVIMTGGLGPTNDDVTKATLNAYFKGSLKRDETVFQHVVAFFKKRNRPMLVVNEAQADVPDVAQVLFNRLGTAPGMLFEKNNTWVVSLPGVPREMQTIMLEELMPRLLAARTGNQVIHHEHILLFGRGESYVAADIKDIEDSLPAHISLAYLPHYGLLKLRLSGKGTNIAQLQSEMGVYADMIHQRELDFVFARKESTLERTVVELLQENRLTIASAESCTGGMVASRITDIPGASAVFMGTVVSYDNNIKHRILGVKNETLEQEGAVSAACVIQMAQSVRDMMQTDIAVAISGILGPSGGTPTKPVGLVFFSVSSKYQTEVFDLNFPYDRAINKEMVVNTALNLVRKHIQAFFL
jgi:nicotinamide-nucleotide amidase